MGGKLRKNLMSLAALAAVIAIAIFIINLDLLMPLESSDIIAYSAAINFSYKNNPDAAVTIEEFSNFECPYCARASRTVEQIILAYGDKVNIKFRHMPFNLESKKTAEASECARDQGKFWEYHHILFNNPNSLNVKNLKEHAEQLALDIEQFNNCFDSGEKRNIIEIDLKEAIQRGVEGTPTFFINNKKLVGAQPFEALKTLIDIELQNK